MKILVLTLMDRSCEEDIYVFDNRDVNVLPTIKEWLKENDMEITLPDHVIDTASFFIWYYDSTDFPKPSDSNHFHACLLYKELLSK